MNILIVEDERFAREHLERQLLAIQPDIHILAKLDTVKATVAWLQAHQADLIFLDIHLADDLSFRIFEQIDVQTPIIFTTAYDQYALQAFKVNSIDYLLKPIDQQELAQALQKYQHTHSQTADLSQLIADFKQAQSPDYQRRFMVSRGDKLWSVPTEDIAYFEGEDRYVFLRTKDGNRYIIDYKLSDLLPLLNPKDWHRLNRSFIASIDSIHKIITLSKSRIKVELRPAADREIFISAAKTREFKGWLNE
ncbi:MAG: LytTR family DNA-binding domain-containing protein [Bacteroidota bacterium]